MITTEWTGAYPNLCSGEWVITIDGKQLVDHNHENWESILARPMNTYGVYDTWSFTDDYDLVEYATYADGLEFTKWVNSDTAKKLFSVISDNGIQLTDRQRHELFKQLQINDWKSGSCGGCI